MRLMRTAPRRRVRPVVLAIVALLASTLVLPVLVAPPATAAIESLSGCTDSSLPPTDDGSSPEVALPFTLGFFGQTYTSAYVNNNGNITFGGPLGAYTPFDLTSTNSVIIAPFFADVDTRSGAVVTYGVTQFGGRTALCAMWNGVGYFSNHADKTNRFQALLVDRNDRGAGDFDIVFNYDSIQWEAGDASQGQNGLGGSSARAGFSNGSGAPNTFFEIEGSAVNGAFLDGGPNSLSAGSIRSATAGRYIFPVVGGAPPSGGRMTGKVLVHGSPAPGAPVTACLHSDTGATEQRCINTQTNASGDYLLEPVPDGNYDLTGYPPEGVTDASPFTIGNVIMSGGADPGISIELTSILFVPEGRVFEVSPGENRSGFPRTFWNQPLVITEESCPGGTGTFTITHYNAALGVIGSGPMVETPPGSGSYRGEGPQFDASGIHGYAYIHVEIDCPDGTEDVMDVTIYIDPSGNILDTDGTPIEGATVTLLRSDSEVGPFEVVENGSAIMSPANRVNPDLSDETGYYGWDVVAGFYKVRAEKSGCGSTESAVLTIPPPVTGLNLILDCEGGGGPDRPTPVARAIDDSCPPGQVPEDGFTDVPPENTHEAAIDCMVWWAIANGRTASQYAPSFGVTRAQMASFIARLIEAAGVALDEGPNAFFDDDSEAYAAHHENINKLANAGIVSGRANGTYGPADNVSRAQMATFLVRAFEFVSQTTMPATADWFPDDEDPGFAAHEGNIDKAAEAGFTGGRPDGTYNPGAAVLRDQMASFLARTLDKLIEDGFTTV